MLLCDRDCSQTDVMCVARTVFEIDLCNLDLTFVGLSTWYVQHSISIFAVRMGMVETLQATPREGCITLRVSMHVSTELELFGDAFVGRRRQIYSLLSTVTGVDFSDIELQSVETASAARMRVFTVEMYVVNLKTAYHNRYVIRLGAHFSNPTSNVRLRMQDMFSQLTQTWGGLAAGHELAILKATVHFPTRAQRRRLLRVLHASHPALPRRRVQGTDWNQTAKFFVRSQDPVDNGDSMLAFSATTGLFSRMCVISARYDRAAYCSMNETAMLHAMDRLFDIPLRTASNGSIVLSKTVAFAPSDVITCAPTKALDASQDLQTLLLDIEVIVYCTTTGAFTLFASNDLTKVGVEKIQVLATKNTSNRLHISLDTWGFNADGTLLSTTPRLERIPALTPIALYAIFGGVAGAVLLCVVAFFFICRQYHTVPSHNPPLFQPSPHYTAVPTFTPTTPVDYTYYHPHHSHQSHIPTQHSAPDGLAPFGHT